MTTQTITPAGWYPDPGHRHQYRYWSGTAWTPMVSDNAVTATDPVQSPPPPAAGQLPPATPPGDEAKMMAWPTSAGPASVPGATLSSQPSGAGFGAYPQIAMAPGQPALGVDPRIAGTVAEYAKRQYKVLAVSGSSVTMERSKTWFNWPLTVLMAFGFGVLALLYVVPWAIWGLHRTYRVTITLGSQGEVEELGDVLAVFDRDRLQAHRRRCIGFGLVIALIAILGAIGVVGSVASGDAPDPLGTALGGGGFFLVLAAIAFIPFRLARKAAKKLGMASEWWRFGM